jgi:hypothetical protein
MRTQKEILDRIQERRPNDSLNFEWPYYVGALTLDNAKQFLKDDVKESDWKQSKEEEIKADAIEYMGFAWEKANKCRGISAGRSISHYIAWMWLLGYDNTERWEDYAYYGKPQLIEICGLLSLDYKKWDDSVRTNTQV